MKAPSALLLSLAALSVACVTNGGSCPGDGLLVHGGTIHLGDGLGGTVEALAVVDGRVVHAGSLAGARAAIGPRADALDLEGGVCVPGLQDAHGHILGLGEALEAVSLEQARSFEDVVAAVAEAARDRPVGTWVTGRGWDQTRWSGGEFPHHRALSRAVPDHLVLLERVDGHAALVNERALRLAGLDGPLRPPPEVAGGRVVLDEEGFASGVLVDAAVGLVARFIPASSAADHRRRILLAQRRLLSEGLTCVHDMGISPEQAAVFQELDAQGLLELRVAGYLWGNDGLEGAAYEELARSDAGRRFRVAGVKLMIDGALGSRGAALLEPYSDAPLERGLLQLEPARLRGLVARSAELGLQPAVHAIGDRGNRVVLDAFAAVLSDSAGLRPRVEHAQVLAPVDWNRLDALGAVPSMQPRHATSDMRWAERRLGPERMAGAYAWRRLASARVPLALGSDFPVEPSAPLLGLYAARTRQDEQGSPPGGFQPEQRLSGVEALEGFTAGASFALGEEHERGRLLVGYFADMTVLDVDPVKAPAERLLGAKILATVIEGRVVYSAP